MSNFDYLSLSGQHLLVFVTLHEVGTVTATAEKLGITQSAVSHSLQKMREIFGDELFVRAGRSVTPTLRSEQLYPQLKAMLTSLGELTQTPIFTPETTDISYKILANDFQSSLFSHVYARVSPMVASLLLEISPANKPTIEALRSETVDFAFSPIPPNHDDIVAKRLFSDRSLCFYDPNIRAAPTTLDELCEGKLVSLTFMKGISLGGNTDDTVRILDDNTCIRVGNFAAIPNFIRGTDLLAVMPGMLKTTVGYEQLANAPLPYEASLFNIYMLWHKKYHKDPQHQWFREQIVKVSEDFYRK